MTGRKGSLGSPVLSGVFMIGVGLVAGAAWWFTGHGFAFWIAVIFLGVSSVGLVVTLVNLIRAMVLRRRARVEFPRATMFHAAYVSPALTAFSGFGWMGVAVADDEGLDVLRGNPLGVDWGASWAEIEDIRADAMQIGRQHTPVLRVGLWDGSNATLRLLGDHGIQPTEAYAERLADELRALQLHSGASQSPPSGGRVSSTEAGLPPHGTSSATTEP